MTGAFDVAVAFAETGVDSFGISCGAALTTPTGVAGAAFLSPPPRRGLGMGGIRAPPGTAPRRTGGIPGGGPGGMRTGGPGGSRTPGGGTPGRSIIPGG